MKISQITEKFNKYWNKIATDSDYIGVIVNSLDAEIYINKSRIKLESFIAWGFDSNDRAFCFNSYLSS